MPIKLKDNGNNTIISDGDLTTRLSIMAKHDCDNRKRNAHYNGGVRPVESSRKNNGLLSLMRKRHGNMIANGDDIFCMTLL
jgi:hypothetical protein